jgi:hypothetical protein
MDNLPMFNRMYNRSNFNYFYNYNNQFHKEEHVIKAQLR